MRSDIQKEECKVHGSGTRAVNRTLLLLLLAAILLVTWHVWVYGPTNQSLKPGLSERPFLILLGSEISDVIFSRSGILAELYDIAAYFLVGVLLAGFIRTYRLAIALRNSLVRHGAVSIFLASFVGILTPLCSCGILTTAITLLFAGLPLAPVMALLISSPLISPSAYLLTLNDLGPQWTVIRVIAAFMMGIFAGGVTHLIRDRGFQTNTLFLEGAVPEGDFHEETYPDKRLKCNCKEKFGNRVAARTNNRFLIFWAKSYDMIWLVGKYVLVGIAIGTVVERYMPSEWIYRLFGNEGRFSVIWITIGSIPIFLHQISASSILYHIKSSIDGTLNGGAGLALLIGGPVTAIPAMTMLWAIFKKRVFVLYMCISLIGTIVLAYSFQYLVFVPHVDTDNDLLRGVRSLSGGYSSIITKTDDNVRVVIDPGGQSIIATYVNHMAESGGVVFDAGYERFLDVSADQFDNSTYRENIAEWLQESGDADEGDILIYNTFYASGLDNSYFSRNALLFRGNATGYNVTVTDRRETPEISGQLLDAYSQLWIIFGGTDIDRFFSEIELDVIRRFSKEGRGLLIVAGQQRGGKGESLTAANQLSSRYGVLFSGVAESAEELEVSSFYYFFNRLSGILQRAYRFMM